MQTRKKSHTKRKVNTLILLSKYLFLINVHTERKKTCLLINKWLCDAIITGLIIK